MVYKMNPHKHFRLKQNILLALLFLFLSPCTLAITNSYDQTTMHPAIPFLDEDGNHVLDSGKAFSSKTSCGGSCHDYDAITHAFHMEMGRDEASDTYGKERGLPHLVSPGYFGGYNCMGGSRTNNLSKKNNSSEFDFEDYGAAGIIKGCSSCHSGGGFAEKDREGIRYDEKDTSKIANLDGDYYEWMSKVGASSHGATSHSDHLVAWDWKETGVVENDCMMCHAQFSALKKFPASGSGLGANDGSDGSDSALDFYKRSRSSALIGHDFFRESTTAIWEFYDIKPDTADGSQLVSFERTFTEGKEGDARGYSMNLNSQGKPIMHWNADAFDENRKANIPMLRFPANDNCMMCHVTSNSRRGFYGFGDNSLAEMDDDGVIEPDYQDDVHKGKTYTADNGEVRAIENCNTCHSRNYNKPTHTNVDLNANHNFLKGNSDMDVRNDLDYDPGALSCEYCHNDMANKVVPSGQANMLDAHRELWKANGDMAGYNKDQLGKITQTHLDIVSCQACHITDKKSRGRPLQIMFRYRQAEDGTSKVFPYNPKIRYIWKNKNGDEVLSRAKIDSVFEVKTDDTGKQYAAIIDPISHEELGQVSYSMGRHGPSYGSPTDYDTFVALKNAYDNLLKQAGVANPYIQQIWLESNEYVMSHNVRPSSSSVPCADCHTRKQSGAFSSLVSADGIFGSGIEKTVTKLVDKRLVDEGLVVLGVDYFKVDDQGVVTENVEDILYSTKINAFTSYFKNSNATTHEAEFKSSTLTEALDELKVTDEGIRQDLEFTIASSSVFLLNTHQGDSVLKETAIIGTAQGLSELLLPKYRVKSSVYNSVSASVKSLVENFVAGGTLASSIYHFAATDPNRKSIPELFEKVYIKLPYRGKGTNSTQIRIIHAENGDQLYTLDEKDILVVNPHSDLSDGYVIFTTDKMRYFAIMDVE